jgi:hypothetical protein
MGPEQSEHSEEQKRGFSFRDLFKKKLEEANAPQAENLQKVREARESTLQDARVERSEQLRGNSSDNLVVDADTLEHPIVARQPEQNPSVEKPDDISKAA